MKTKLVSMILLVAAAAIADTALAQAAGAGSRTAEEWKAILSTPAALFVLMCLASLSQGLGTIITAKRQGSTMTVGSYLSYWPELLSTVVLNALGFATLILTDQLNFASALGIGFGLANVVDMVMPAKTSRSAALAATTAGSPEAVK